jgi:hypothetical protein
MCWGLARPAAPPCRLLCATAVAPRAVVPPLGACRRWARNARLLCRGCLLLVFFRRGCLPLRRRRLLGRLQCGHSHSHRTWYGDHIWMHELLVWVHRSHDPVACTNTCQVHRVRTDATPRPPLQQKVRAPTIHGRARTVAEGRMRSAPEAASNSSSEFTHFSTERGALGRPVHDRSALSVSLPLGPLPSDSIDIPALDRAPPNHAQI